MTSYADFLQGIKYAVATIGGLVTGFLGGWDAALKVLVLFVVLDYLTGLAAAYFEKRLDSNIGFKGITRKVLLFIPIGVAYYLDQLLGQQVIRSLAIWFYLANEGLSIIENLSKCGVPIPPAIMNALQQLKKRGESTDDNGTK
ncbi:phage holin family protein [Caldanaerobius polysaccharolyticus]|uniref:phage holin family protein n=1 Tax=Caldanaerobius polysaccharolyticus TaxID=44256 RepID=UPI0005511158|nr:phage holin family protein [Caldanaerobius polysaccharolyticus]